MAASGEPHAREVEERIVVVWFARPEDVTAAKSVALVPPIVEASKKGRVVLLADAPPDLRFVEPAMVSFWLNTMLRPDVNISHVGVVTKSRAVRAVISALRAALSIKSRSLEVATFDHIDQAIDWGRTQR